jgi:hypothetical protein
MTLPLGRLLGENMASIGLRTLDPAFAADLESLRRAPVGLELWHCMNSCLA